MEDIVLPVAVTNLNALRALDPDHVLARLRSYVIDQAHQRLRRCYQIMITVGRGPCQLRHQWLLPCLGSLLMPGKHHLAIRPTGEPFFTRAFNPA
jgi:hypothetical protein